MINKPRPAEDRVGCIPVTAQRMMSLLCLLWSHRQVCEPQRAALSQRRQLRQREGRWEQQHVGSAAVKLWGGRRIERRKHEPNAAGLLNRRLQCRKHEPNAAGLLDRTMLPMLPLTLCAAKPRSAEKKPMNTGACFERESVDRVDRTPKMRRCAELKSCGLGCTAGCFSTGNRRLPLASIRAVPPKQQAPRTAAAACAHLDEEAQQRLEGVAVVLLPHLQHALLVLHLQCGRPQWGRHGSGEGFRWAAPWFRQDMADGRGAGCAASLLPQAAQPPLLSWKHSRLQRQGGTAAQYSSTTCAGRLAERAQPIMPSGAAQQRAKAAWRSSMPRQQAKAASQGSKIKTVPTAGSPPLPCCRAPAPPSCTA